MILDNFQSVHDSQTKINMIREAKTGFCAVKHLKLLLIIRNNCKKHNQGLGRYQNKCNLTDQFLSHILQSQGICTCSFRVFSDLLIYLASFARTPLQNKNIMSKLFTCEDSHVDMHSDMRQMKRKQYLYLEILNIEFLIIF